MEKISALTDKAAQFFNLGEQKILGYAGGAAFAVGCLELLLIATGFFTSAAYVFAGLTAAMGLSLLMVFAASKADLAKNGKKPVITFSPKMRFMGQGIFYLVLALFPFMAIAAVSQSIDAVHSGKYDGLIHAFFLIHVGLFAVYMSAMAYQSSSEKMDVANTPA